MKGKSSARFDLKAYLSRQKSLVDQHLDRFLPPASTPPETIHEAMRYSVFAGGKRLRPILALAAGEALAGDAERIIPLACALEMIHTFSLIHDDLPAIDDDDFRRGRPTLHKQYDEAVAVLAGDGLLVLAFETLTAIPAAEDGGQARLEVVNRVCRAIGTTSGMIAGQVYDILTEGQPYDQQRLETIHRSKTGALITASVECAAVLSGASREALQRMSAYGTGIGLAFQIVDDILDVEGSSSRMGKSSGRDQTLGKATYPALHGLEASRRMADGQVRNAIAQLDFLGPEAEPLRSLARFISSRQF